MTKDELFRSITQRLKGEARLPHQASSLGYDIYHVVQRYGRSGNRQSNELVETFKRKLKDWQFEDLPLRQARYAERLALYSGELLYEEMHKLFALRDEIKALEELGLTLSKEEKEKLDNAMAERLEKEKSKALMVAEDRVDQSNRNWWWYKL